MQIKYNKQVKFVTPAKAGSTGHQSFAFDVPYLGVRRGESELEHKTFAYLQECNAKRAILLFDCVCVIYDPRTRNLTDYKPLKSELPCIDTLYHEYGLTYMEMVGCFTPQCCLDYKNNSIFVLDDGFLLPEDVVPENTPCQGAYTAALNSIPQIMEQECTWDQVWEIRKDEDAKRKIRKLRAWFSEAMASTSPSHAGDIIENHIEDYRWAIRKHGLSTTIGTLKTIVKPGTILSASGAALISNIISGPAVASVSAGVVLASSAAVTFAEYLLGQKDLAYGRGSEVAILFDLNESLRKK